MSWAGVVIAAGTVVGAGINAYSNSQASEAQAKANMSAMQAQMYMAELGANATLKAAGAGAEAIKYGARLSYLSSAEALEFQKKVYKQGREDQLPWLETGQRALGTLEGMVEAGPGEFEEGPGYQFRLEQGNDNILSNAAATGGLASGRTLKALQSFGQDYASNEYSNFLNQYYQSLTPWQSLAGMGQTSSISLGQQGNTSAASVAGILGQAGANQLAAGQSLASLYGSAGNALASGYTNQGNILGNYYNNQGNIAANNYMNTGNAITGAINNGLMAYGTFKGWGQTSTPTAPESGSLPQTWAI